MSVVKLVVVGDSHVGKTAMIQQFVNRRFTTDYKVTLGADFAAKPIAVNDMIVTLQIWDTAGQERYRSLSTSYFKGCEAAIVVFDATSEESFEHVPAWVDDVYRSVLGPLAPASLTRSPASSGAASEQPPPSDLSSAPPSSSPASVVAPFPVIVVANKLDLCDDDGGARKVPKRRAQEFCDANGWKYRECSAKFGDNVDEVFKVAAAVAVERRNASQSAPSSAGRGVGIRRPARGQPPSSTGSDPREAPPSSVEGGGLRVNVARRWQASKDRCSACSK